MAMRRLRSHFVLHPKPKGIPIMNPRMCDIYATLSSTPKQIAERLYTKQIIATRPSGIRNSKEIFNGFTSMATEVNEKMAAEAPMMRVDGLQKKVLKRKDKMPPVKKTDKVFSAPKSCSKTLPKTKRKSMLLIKCNTLAWRNNAVIKVHTLPLKRLITLKPSHSAVTSLPKYQDSRNVRMQRIIIQFVLFNAKTILNIEY